MHNKCWFSLFPCFLFWGWVFDSYWDSLPLATRSTLTLQSATESCFLNISVLSPLLDVITFPDSLSVGVSCSLSHRESAKQGRMNRERRQDHSSFINAMSNCHQEFLMTLQINKCSPAPNLVHASNPHMLGALQILSFLYQGNLHNNYSYQETLDSATCTICKSLQWRITFAVDGKEKVGELVIYHNGFFMISSEHLWLFPKAVNRFKVLHYWTLIRSLVCIHFKC